MKILIRIFLLSIFICSAVFAQQDNLKADDDSTDVINPLIIGYRMQYGYIFAHSQYVESANGARPIEYELDLGWQLYNRDTWGDCHNYPRYGFALRYSDYRKHDVLGHVISGGPYMQYFFGLPSTFNFYFKGGAGFSYGTKPHDPVTNKENWSYATHVNFWLYVNTGIVYQINKRIGANLGISFNHVSNAGIKEPNGGVNYPAVSLGFDYNLEPVDYLPHRGYLTDYDRGILKTRHDIIAHLGFSAIDFPDRGQFPLYGLSYQYSHQIWRFSAINTGIELEFNGRAKRKIKEHFKRKVDYKRLSVFIGHEFLMGNTKFSVAIGGYIYRPMVESDFIYQRYSIFNEILPNIQAGVIFKSYRHVADVANFMIAYSIK